MGPPCWFGLEPYKGATHLNRKYFCLRVLPIQGLLGPEYVTVRYMDPYTEGFEGVGLDPQSFRARLAWAVGPRRVHPAAVLGLVALLWFVLGLHVPA